METQTVIMCNLSTIVYLSARLSHPPWYQLVDFSAAHSFPLSSTAGTFAYSEGEKDFRFYLSTIVSCLLTSSHPPAHLLVWRTIIHGATKQMKQQWNTQKKCPSCLSSPLWQHKLTVCGAEVSGTPLGLSPVWGTRKDLLIHICTVSGKETITHCTNFHL